MQKFDFFKFSGYKYSYPFLDKNTRMLVEDNHVRPLFKQIINIEHPTMAFIGIPFSTAHNWMCDLQVNITILKPKSRKSLRHK